MRRRNGGQRKGSTVHIRERQKPDHTKRRNAQIEARYSILTRWLQTTKQRTQEMRPSNVILERLLSTSEDLPRGIIRK